MFYFATRYTYQLKEIEEQITGGTVVSRNACCQCRSAGSNTALDSCELRQKIAAVQSSDVSSELRFFNVQKFEEWMQENYINF